MVDEENAYERLVNSMVNERGQLNKNYQDQTILE